MKKYIKPTSESISLLFGSEVAQKFSVGSDYKGGEQGSNRYNLNESWDDIEED